MGEVTNEQVNLMLRLFEERREARLREAREWFGANFHVKSIEDLMRICPPGSKENAYMRMVLGYWEMVASIVNCGLIDEDLFLESNGEQRGAMGRLGTGEAGDRRVARDVQQSEVPRQPRRTMQAPRSLARSAQPRLQRCHSQVDGADATGRASGKGAGRGWLEFRRSVHTIFCERPRECGDVLVHSTAGLPHSLSALAASGSRDGRSQRESQQIGKGNHA